MNTPILDMIREYCEKKPVRLHMPGHKGRLDGSDITEIDGADSLFEASGVIKESEGNAGEIFGADTFYSTEGSSLSIRAMVHLIGIYARTVGKEPLIFAARNAHKSFLSAAALTDVKVKWMIAKENKTYLSCPITPADAEEYILSSDVPPVAMYLTSPDYLGNILDVKGIGEVCKKHGVLLAVDNAHGAYLKFLKETRHPIDLGADMCCDSAHKTLEVLGGGGYLHISKEAPSFFKERAKEAMSLFASTSPSYLILSSLDRANSLLAGDFSNVLTTFVDKIAVLKEKLKTLGYEDVSCEPLKITIKTKPYGYLGGELSEILKGEGIYCEFYDSDYLVMMLSPYMEERELDLLYSALSSVPKKAAISGTSPIFNLPKAAMTPREAILSASEKLPVGNCLGRVLSTVSVGCPPAVPLIVSGEVVDVDVISAAKYYGITHFSVTK